MFYLERKKKHHRFGALRALQTPHSNVNVRRKLWDVGRKEATLTEQNNQSRITNLADLVGPVHVVPQKQVLVLGDESAYFKKL